MKFHTLTGDQQPSNPPGRFPVPRLPQKSLILLSLNRSHFYLRPYADPLF